MRRWSTLALLGIGALALADGARAQTAAAPEAAGREGVALQDIDVTGQIAVPSTAIRPAERRAAASRAAYRRSAATNADDGEGFGGSDTAAGASNVQGNTATPATFPAGTLDFGNGISMLVNYTSESAANPYGGIRQGSEYAGQAFVGLDFDLQRLAGLDGASIHAIATQRHGRSLSNDVIGNKTSVQEIFGGGQTARLTLLSYQQKLFNNHLDFEVGRLVANVNFLSSPIYCNFQNNATCGNPTFTFKTTNFTFFPVSTWGGHAKVWLDDQYKYFFHIGAYEVNPNTQRPTDNGIDFSTRGATGAVVPMELGYSTTFANDTLPRNYGIGAIVDRSDYPDPVLNTAGRPLVFNGGNPFTQFGRSLVYARFDQMIWRPDPSAPQGLTLFGVAMKGTGGRQIETHFLELGLLQTGTFRDRPYDTIGFVVSTQKFSSLGLAGVRAARASLGLDPRDVATNQIMMELNYGIQLTPAARLTPQLQYIVNPDQTRFPFRPKPIPDAFVLGAKFSCDIFTLLGLAKGPGSL